MEDHEPIARPRQSGDAVLAASGGLDDAGTASDSHSSATRSVGLR